jgi:IS5 family transposase
VVVAVVVVDGVVVVVVVVDAGTVVDADEVSVGAQATAVSELPVLASVSAADLLHFRWKLVAATASAGSARQAAITAAKVRARSGLSDLELIGSGKGVVLAAGFWDSAAKRAEFTNGSGAVHPI